MNSVFSERLARLRKQRDLSQYELARALGYSRGQIANYEQGSRSPDLSVLNEIASFFGVTTDYLLGRDIPLPKEARMTITLKDGRTVAIDDLSPEDRRIVEEIINFAAAKLSLGERKDGQ